MDGSVEGVLKEGGKEGFRVVEFPSEDETTGTVSVVKMAIFMAPFRAAAGSVSQIPMNPK